MSLPLNIVVPNGELYSLTDEEYQLVENIPKLVYTDINSERFAATEDGKLFDIIQRQLRFTSPIPIKNEEDLDIVQAIDSSINHKTLLTRDGKIVNIHGHVVDNNWQTHSRSIMTEPRTLVLIPTQSEQYIEDLTSEDLEWITKVKTSMIVTKDGIYHLYSNSLLAEGMLVHNGDNVIDCTYMLLWIHKRHTLTFMLLMNTGEIQYRLGESDWRIMEDVIISQPEKHRFIEIGDHRALVNEGGEISIVDGVSKLITIDLPLSCFNIGQSRSTKSARAVVDSSDDS